MKRTAHDKYKVTLQGEELDELKIIISKGTSKARVITRARILKATHEGKLDREITEALGIVRSTIHDTRKHYVEGRLKKALYDAPHPGKARKLTGTQEAKVVAIACTKAPKGYRHWTMDLLTEEVHKQGMEIGRTAIWKILMRNNLKPWREKNVGHLRDYP